MRKRLRHKRPGPKPTLRGAAPISMNIEAGQLRELRAAAKADGRSTSSIVREAVAQWLQTRPKASGRPPGQ